MALAAHASYTTSPDNVIPVQVKSGATIYNGALCMADTTSGGPAEPYDGTIGAILLGWHFGNVENDGTSAPDKTAKIAKGSFTFRRLTVSNLAGTTADIGKKVYARDDGSYNVTSQTTHQVVVGHVIESYSSTVADVKTVTDIFGTVGV